MQGGRRAKRGLTDGLTDCERIAQKPVQHHSLEQGLVIGIEIPKPRQFFNGRRQLEEVQISLGQWGWIHALDFKKAYMFYIEHKGEGVQIPAAALHQTDVGPSFYC